MIYDFIDTSAFLKLFIAEQGSAEMLAFVDAENQLALVVSALLPIEACSAVCRLRKGSRMTPDEASSALHAIAEEVQQFTIQPLTPAVFEAAALLTERHALRALDALQLASAFVCRSYFDAPQMRFIASDLELLKAAEAENFATWNPVP